MPSAKKPPVSKASRSAQAQGPDHAASRVLRRFRFVFNAVKTHFREVEKKAGVAGAQLWALSVIRDQPGLRMTELAAAMDVHQSTASNLVRSLVERDLVSVVKGEGQDGRSVQMRLLAAGARILRRAPGPYSGVLPVALAGMNPKTLARLDKDLGEVIAALGVKQRGAGVLLGQP